MRDPKDLKEPADWPPHPSEDPRVQIPEALRPPEGRPSAPPTAAPGRTLADVGRAWGVALEFIATILAGAITGWFVDRWRGSSPLATVIGLGTGFAVAFVRIIRTTLAQEARERARRTRQEPPPPDRPSART